MEKASKKVKQQLLESPEQNLKKPDRYNLRKSLAWDGAFFTSEGFLDSGELEIMNSTYSKAIGTALPEIQEELRKSSESTPIPESETLSLEQPELNLFENVRDSFKMSLGSYNHTTKMIHLDKKKKHKRQMHHLSEVSTVGEEMLYNPHLTKDEETFKSIMENSNLAYPKMIDVAVSANIVCGLQGVPKKTEASFS